MAQIFGNLSVVSFILAVVLSLLAIFFWFKLNIKKVIDDLSGRTAKKTIEQMREKNEKKTKRKPRSASYVEEPALQTGSTVRKVGSVEETADLGGRETVPLKPQDVTAALSNNGAANDLMGTALLNNGVAETALLNEALAENITKESEDELVILQSIVLTGTNELIEIGVE